MPLALLQLTLDPPPRQALERAFAASAWRTRLDGVFAWRDAYGVLAKGLTADAAAELQGLLRAEGVETEIVDQARQPELPTLRRTRRVEPHATHLELADALGRPVRLEWDQVRIIAAGLVYWHEVRSSRRETVVGYGRNGAIVVNVQQDVENRGARLGLEVVSHELRFRAMADELLSRRGPTDRPTWAANFVQTVRELLRRAPQAGANRGAVALAMEPPATFTYPSRHSFEEETRWLLWRLRPGAADAAAGAI